MNMILSSTINWSNQRGSRNDEAMNFLLSFSEKKRFRSSIVSGRSRSYQRSFPLSTLSKVVSRPQPISTMVAFGCFSRNRETVLSIKRLRITHPYLLISDNDFANVEKSKSIFSIISTAFVSINKGLAFCA